MKHKSFKRSIYAGIIRAVLSWFVCMIIVCGMLTTAFSVMINQSDIYERAASASVEKQMLVIQDSIEKSAAKYHFAPTAIHFTSHEIQELNHSAIEWWMSLVKGNAVEEPYFTLEGLEQAILNDTYFQNNVEPAQQKMIARDYASASIEKTISSVVLPVRTPLLLMARERIAALFDLSRIPEFALIASWVCAGLVLILLIIIRLLCTDSHHALLWYGGSIGGAGISLLFLLAILALMELPVKINEMSEVLSIQIVSLWEICRLWFIAIPVLLFIAGEVLLFLGWKDSEV